MAAHAKIGFSTLDRVQACPGSVPLSEGMPNKSSEAAQDGTDQHTLGQLWLENATNIPAKFLSDDWKERREAVALYVKHVRDLLVTDKASVLHVEQRVAITVIIWGTADAIVWLPTFGELHIIDYKGGAGVPVDVRTLQLKGYLLAALLTFGYPAKKLVATIVQPRCPHPDGPIRSIEYTPDELLDFYADLQDLEDRVEAATKANDKLPFLKPTEKGCRWCKASPICPAMKALANEKARQAFNPGERQTYDPAELAETLDSLPILEAWIKNVRQFAYDEAELGKSIPGYKLVEKMARRTWRSETDAGALLLDMLGPEVFENSLKSPATIEKMLSKGDRDVLAELTVKESSGHALVHESDKRPAVKTDAKSAFSPNVLD